MSERLGQFTKAGEEEKRFKRRDLSFPDFLRGMGVELQFAIAPDGGLKCEVNTGELLRIIEHELETVGIRFSAPASLNGKGPHTLIINSDDFGKLRELLTAPSPENNRGWQGRENGRAHNGNGHDHGR